MPESIRISDAAFLELKAEKTVSKRSLGAQAEYWMNIGRAIERSSSFNNAKIKKALLGQLDPTELSAEEDAVYISQFMDQMKSTTAEQKDFFNKQKESGVGVGLGNENELVYQRDIKQT